MENIEPAVGARGFQSDRFCAALNCIFNKYKTQPLLLNVKSFSHYTLFHKNNAANVCLKY